jgi:hypothetical protein
MNRLHFIYLVSIIAVSCNNPKIGNTASSKNQNIKNIENPKADSLVSVEKPFFLSFYYGMSWNSYDKALEKSKESNPLLFDEKNQLLLTTKSYSNPFILGKTIQPSGLQYITLIFANESNLRLAFREDLLSSSEKKVLIYTGNDEGVNMGGQIVPIPEVVRVKSNLSKYTKEYAANSLVGSSKTNSLYKTYVSRNYVKDISTKEDTDAQIFPTRDLGEAGNEFRYIPNGDLIVSEIIQLYQDKYGKYTFSESNKNLIYCHDYVLADSKQFGSSSTLGNKFQANNGLVDEINYSIICKSINRKYTWLKDDVKIELQYNIWIPSSKHIVKIRNPIITYIQIYYYPKLYLENINKNEQKGIGTPDSLSVKKMKETKDII